MNILILSASTGGGHMRASKAIQDYMMQQDKSIRVEIVDTLKYINPILNKTITNGYVYLATKTPRLYGKLYYLSNREHKLKNFVSKVNNLLSNKLLPLLKDYRPDIIVTTHPFSTEMVSRLKEKFLIKTPLLCVMTDYAPHKTWINNNVDAYIVSNDDMLNKMVQLGVDSNIIYPYGIPIDEVFFEEKDKKKVLEELDLNTELPTILMMAGSFGVANVFKIYRDIENIDIDFQIIIITGKNEKLYDQFREIVGSGSKKTKLIYFTDEVNKYMQASDIIITKPGGLTITESIACNIPMAIFNAIPGQEEENAEFLVRHNMATKIGDENSCADVIVDLLLDKNKLDNMKKACKSFDKNHSSRNIFILINDLLSGKYNCGDDNIIAK